MLDIGTKTFNIAIFDDETARALAWREKLQAIKGISLSIQVPSHLEIYSELDQLYLRRGELAKGKTFESVPCKLDELDILIVDYDLRDLEDHRGFATGEEIAYAARLFSKVKIIVVVNHPDIGLNNFDLTLERDRNLKADLYIGEAQISNPGLWLSEPCHDSFLPWSWPCLLEDAINFDDCSDQILQNLSSPVLPNFGLESESTRPSADMMGDLGVSDLNATFKEIIEEGKPTPFVRPKDKEQLLQDNDRLSRVLTAIIKKWLRRWVIPSQTIIADAPHLAVVIPWSIKNYGDKGSWLKLTGRGMMAINEQQDVFHKSVNDLKFQRQEWIGKPGYLIQKIRIALEAVDGLIEAFNFSTVPSINFAEDLSRFIPRDETLEYNLTLDGQSQVRAVCQESAVTIQNPLFMPNDVAYVPQSMMV